MGEDTQDFFSWFDVEETAVKESFEPIIVCSACDSNDHSFLRGPEDRGDEGWCSSEGWLKDFSDDEGLLRWGEAGVWGWGEPFCGDEAGDWGGDSEPICLLSFCVDGDFSAAGEEGDGCSLYGRALSNIEGAGDDEEVEFYFWVSLAWLIGQVIFIDEAFHRKEDFFPGCILIFVFFFLGGGFDKDRAGARESVGEFFSERS